MADKQASSHQVTVQVKLSTDPPKVYVAETAFFDFSRGRRLLGFGQWHIGSAARGLRSLLLVSVTKEGYQRLSETTGDFYRTLRAQSANEGLKPDTLEMPGREPEGTELLTANFFRTAYAEHDACIDLHFASPPGIQIAHDAAPTAIEAKAICRVVLPTSLLLAILHEVHEVHLA